MEQQEDLMTAQQAISAFIDAGLSEPTFRRRIKEGLIKGELPKGRQRGALYPKSQVLAAITYKKKKPQKTSRAHRRKQFEKIPLIPTTFTSAIPMDMPAIADFLETLFDSRPNVERWSAWIERNPEVAYILRSNDNVVGCGFILPLTEKKILSILAEEVTPITNPDEIFAYGPGTSLCLYVRSIGVVQRDVNPKQRTYWAERLILGLTKLVISLGARGVIIERIYGRSDTKAGERTMRILGFTQIPTITSHKNFCIDIATSGLESVIRYKHALDQWRAKHEGA